MNFGSDESNNEPLSEINIIPLVDVMLVLLILFILTAPLLTPHAVEIDVPKESSQEIPDKPNRIVLAINEKGELFWNDKAITDQYFRVYLKQAAQKKPVPDLHIRAHKETQYQRLAEIMSAAQDVRISRLGFITEPE